MAEDSVEDARARALLYGTAINNSFFDLGRGVARFSRSLVHIRVSWFGLAWGFITGLLFFIILMALGRVFGTDGFFAALFHWIPAVIYSVIIGMLGYRLANWSPMKNTTGEGLSTYFGIKFRQFVSRGGFGKGKATKTYVYSRAKTLDGRGVKIKASELLGTQPLPTAPPFDPDHEEEYEGQVYSTTYNLRPRGIYAIVDKGSHDGLGRS